MAPVPHRPSLPLALGALLFAAGLLGAAATGAAELVNSATARSASGGLFNGVAVLAQNDPDEDNNVAGVAVRVIDSAEAVSTVVAVADLELSKTADPAVVAAGEQVTYHLEVVNLGPSAAQDVAINDSVPLHMSFVSVTASPGASCSTPPVGGTGAVTCQWAGATGPGGVRSLDLVVQVAPGAPSTTVGNVASASSPTDDPEPDNDGATADVLVTALSVLEIPALSPAAALLLAALLAGLGLLAARRA